jgi:hypothetical protein
MKLPFESTNHHKPVAFELPRLSDEAVIQIQDFLHHALDLFEDHYGQQIDHFYQSLYDASRDAELDLGDSPF